MVEFFDFLYLGIFVVLSTAYDDRFYHGRKPPPRLFKEAAFAVGHFHSLLHRFSQRYVVMLEGEAVSISYVVDRMLGEFAAASVILAKAIYEFEGYDSDDEVEGRIPTAQFSENIKNILQTSHPEVFPYYSRCLYGGHKDFLWTGPVVQILPRSNAISSLITFMTKGEMLDLPSHQIYTEDVDDELPIPPASDTVAQLGKRRVDSLIVEEIPSKKRSRRS